MLPRIIQIVKRFGPVGGMESYVWRLTHGLSERGLSVSVVCEQVIGEVSVDIDIIQVEKSQEKPRWKSMLLFRARVDSLLKDRFQGQKIIVHSHERSLSHHVTTFHGPPINSNGNLNWIQKLSPRIRGWMQMERHELLSSSVQCIVPVSSRVGDALTDQYSDLKNKQVLLGWPGVEPVVDSRGQDDGRRESSRFLFVGKEWKRKGLRRAIDVFEAFRAANPNAALDVFGVVSSDVPKKLSKKAGIRFKGWSSEISWGNYDVLIHPAENEPFGMVIAEARSHGIAVLMSDRVGAADLAFDNVRIVPFDASLSEWVLALLELLASPDRLSEVKWTWNDLVDLHCQTIYPRLEVKIL
jgi:UDP-glucose:(heptosyl)LPS alpha-1,3-glucosyltransferase